MSRKNYSKSVDRMSLGAVLVLFASVGLLISDRFVEVTFSNVLLILGIVGLLTFLFMVFKTGKIMEKEDQARAEALNTPYTSSQDHAGTRDLLHRSSLEDKQQYRM